MLMQQLRWLKRVGNTALLKTKGSQRQSTPWGKMKKVLYHFSQCYLVTAAIGDNKQQKGLMAVWDYQCRMVCTWTIFLPSTQSRSALLFTLIYHFLQEFTLFSEHFTKYYNLQLNLLFQVLLYLQRQTLVTYLGFGSSYFFIKNSIQIFSTFIVKFFLKFQHSFYFFWKITLIYSLFRCS